MKKFSEFIDDCQQCHTIGDLLDRYLKEVSPTKAPSTHLTNTKQSKYLRAAFGKMRIEALNPQSIYRYMDARGKKSQVRANRELALLSHMYTKAIRWGYAPTNPCLGIERFKETPRKRYIEDWEYNAFKEFAGPQIAAYMDFKLLTGLRQGDVLKIKLSDIKHDGIHVHISKTNKDIIIEWTEHLRAAVDQVRAIKRPIQSMYLFSTRKGQPYTSDGFRSIWQRKMVKALEQNILNERFRDHDIRAKTGSDTDLEHASSLLAHLDKKTTEKHYRRKPSVVRPLK